MVSVRGELLARGEFGELAIDMLYVIMEQELRKSRISPYPPGGR